MAATHTQTKDHYESKISAHNLGQIGGTPHGEAAPCSLHTARSDSGTDSQDGLKSEQLQMNNLFKIKIGKILREIRLENNKSQAKIAALLGKDQSQISLIERGLQDIKLSEVKKICRHFNLDLVAVVAKIEYCVIE